MVSALVIQPCVPLYREPLFSRLADSLDLRIIAGERDIDGLHSVPVKGVRIDLRGNTKKLPFGLLWQRSVAFCSLKGCDVLVMGGNLRYLSSILLLMRAKIIGLPVVWWGQLRSKSIVGLTGKRWLMMFWSDSIIVYSDQERHVLIRSGVKSERVYSIRNTIDTNLVRREAEMWPEERLAVFRTANHLDGRELILVLGRAMPKARFDLLPEISRRLYGRFPNHLFICIGERGDSDLAKSIASTCNPGSIRFLGRMGDKELAPYALCSRLFFYPGDVGLSLHHALAYGLPAVIHEDRNWHMPECDVFQDNLHGYTFHRGDVSSATEMIGRILLDKASKQMGLNAQKFLVGNYSISGMASRMIQSIQAAIGLRGNI